MSSSQEIKSDFIAALKPRLRKYKLPPINDFYQQLVEENTPPSLSGKISDRDERYIPSAAEVFGLLTGKSSPYIPRRGTPTLASLVIAEYFGETPQTIFGAAPSHAPHKSYNPDSHASFMDAMKEAGFHSFRSLYQQLVFENEPSNFYGVIDLARGARLPVTNNGDVLPLADELATLLDKPLFDLFRYDPLAKEKRELKAVSEDPIASHQLNRTLGIYSALLGQAQLETFMPAEERHTQSHLKALIVFALTHGYSPERLEELEALRPAGLKKYSRDWEKKVEDRGFSAEDVRFALNREEITVLVQNYGLDEGNISISRSLGLTEVTVEKYQEHQLNAIRKLRHPRNTLYLREFDPY